jgi:Dolichyl-phosphate-mannose-protein mannosyltransferase
VVSPQILAAVSCQCPLLTTFERVRPNLGSLVVGVLRPFPLTGKVAATRLFRTGHGSVGGGTIVHASDDRTKDDSGTAGTVLETKQPDGGFDRDPLETPPGNIQRLAARRTKLVLAGVIVAFVILASVVAIKTPAYESGDEPSHVQNIETLVSGHWYGMNSQCHLQLHISGLRAGPHGVLRPSGPTSATLVHCSGFEPGQAPLYYLLFAGWQKVVGIAPHIPVNSDPATTFLVANGLFLHHSVSDWRFLLWLRLPNVLLGALTVLVVFFAIREITDDRWTPVVGAAVIAFLPHFVFLSAFVTNDNLVSLLGAVLTLVALRYVRAPGLWRMALVGAVFGLLFATKQSTLTVGLVLLVLVLVVQSWRRRAQHLAVALIAALATCGWYLIQNSVRYGDPLARTATTKYLTDSGGLGTWPGTPYKVTDPLKLVFFDVPQRIFDLFWYESGWLPFRWSWPVSLLFWSVCVAALFGLIHRRVHVERRILVTLWALVVTALMSVWVLAFQTATYKTSYAFVGIAALAALVALGVERWRLPVRFLLPAMGLCGTLIAIQQNVLAVHWG